MLLARYSPNHLTASLRRGAMYPLQLGSGCLSSESKSALSLLSLANNTPDEPRPLDEIADSFTSSMIASSNRTAANRFSLSSPIPGSHLLSLCGFAEAHRPSRVPVTAQLKEPNIMRYRTTKRRRTLFSSARRDL